ncbi:MAG: hypothetical protein HOP15_02955 [Planctomycetes bacterium]|nr:hypothetical protein [Planctomycetota bacterium]
MRARSAAVGGDIALANGVARLILEEGLENRAFVARHIGLRGLQEADP